MLFSCILRTIEIKWFFKFAVTPEDISEKKHLVTLYRQCCTKIS